MVEVLSSGNSTIPILRMKTVIGNHQIKQMDVDFTITLFFSESQRAIAKT